LIPNVASSGCSFRFTTRFWSRGVPLRVAKSQPFSFGVH
jgi:hypothetical protein